MREYGEQNALVGRRVGKQVKNIPTRFDCMAICISSTNLKQCLIGISEMNFCSQDLHQKWTGRPKQSIRSGIDIIGGERIVSQVPFLLVGVGIYGQSFTFHSAVLVLLVKG